MTTTLNPTAPAAASASTGTRLLFDGEDGFAATTARDTWTTSSSDPTWAEAVVARLGEGERALVSLAFAPGGPAVAHRVAAGPLPRRAASTPPAGGEHRVTAVPDEATYADRVRTALERIGSGQLEKVVLGRCLDVVSSPPITADGLLDRLLATRPGRYVFSVPLGAGPGAPLLVGASPELLVRRRGPWVTSVPLAGSVPRVADPDEDRRRAEALRSSAKDLAEHAFVVDAIVDALRPVCVEVDAPSEPELLATDTLWHLASPVRARLAPGVAGPSALRLAQLLQPTPAVGGVPAGAALATIDDLEGDLRSHLAGAVGWVDADGDGELAVTIRSGILDGERLRLFAGAGIVAGSDPDAEVRETGAKLATMARAVGL